MFKKLMIKLKKNQYIKEYHFTNEKNIIIKFHKKDNFKPNFIVNPDHIFLSNGYQTIITSEKSAETIDVTDFKSQYPAEHFKTAINSKLISDAFTSLNRKKDLLPIILIAVGICIVLLIYILFTANGLIKGV
jgi:hypothetical protein